jgi:RNA polymerase sigma-70 factor (ECF subfamily)
MNNDFLSSQSDGASQSRPVSLCAQDEVALIKACQQHNQEAFALLVRKHLRPLFTLAVSLLQDDELAAIITQDTFLAAWEALPSLPAEANVALWLSHLICQRFLHEHQQRSSAPRRRNAKREAIQRRENQRTLVRGVQASLPYLRTLPRVIVILRYVQGLTYEEIAWVLTLPIRTVKMHLFGARNLLKTQMQIPPLSGLSLEEGKQQVSDLRS